MLLFYTLFIKRINPQYKFVTINIILFPKLVADCKSKKNGLTVISKINLNKKYFTANFNVLSLINK